MPWTVKDVDKHKKGLSPDQKKKWVSVANSVYKKCLSDGGNDKSCAPKAIRVANSKFSEEPMKTEQMKLKRAALCFTESDAKASVFAKKEGEARKLSMKAYSGQIIKGHWYWGDLAIDTAGVSFAKKEIPVLEDHMTDRKIGFGSFGVNEKHEIVALDSTLLNNERALEFINNSDQGFPYQASIYGKPSIIERVEEGAFAEVNGYKLKGPGTVWRKSVIHECSVCTFGQDGNTKSVAMTEDEEVVMEVEGSNTFTEEEVTMDLEKLKADYPDLYSQVLAQGRAEATTAFTKEKADLEKKITDLTAEKTQLSEDNRKVSDRVQALERRESIRKEQEIRLTADGVFRKKMTAANIPERLHSKIRKMVDHEKFVKDDVLDEHAFSEAIDTELKDWISEKDGEEAILGLSLAKRTEEETSDALVGRMLGHVGQESKE